MLWPHLLPLPTAGCGWGGEGKGHKKVWTSDNACNRLTPSNSTPAQLFAYASDLPSNDTAQRN